MCLYAPLFFLAARACHDPIGRNGSPVIWSFLPKEQVGDGIAKKERWARSQSIALSFGADSFSFPFLVVHRFYTQDIDE